MDNKNQPAFPVNEETTDRIDAGTKIYSGLSKREMFAMAAMQGLISKTDPNGMTVQDFAVLIEDSVKISDAILNELSKTQP